MSLLHAPRFTARARGITGYVAGVLQTWEDHLALIESQVGSAARHWRMDNASSPMVDLAGVGKLVVAGAGHAFDQSSLLSADTTGGSIRLSGSDPSYLEVAAHSTLQSAAGTVLVAHQHDTLDQKATLLAKDAGGTTGGMALEVTLTGQPRSFITEGPTPQVLLGVAGTIDPKKAYCSVLRWGTGGLNHRVYDEDGQLVADLSHLTTAGPVQASVLRVGAWHTGVSRHDGYVGRIVWFTSRLSDAQVGMLASAPLTIWNATPVADSVTVAPSGSVTVDVQANDLELVGDELTVLGTQSGGGTFSRNSDGKRINYVAPTSEGVASVPYSLSRKGITTGSVNLSVAIVIDSPSAITLKPIYMWRNPNNDELAALAKSLGPADIGELKITDTNIGGTIQSRNPPIPLPAFTLEVDPTTYVSGANGTKTSWSAQFRNSTKGTWSRLGTGNFQFTPGTTPGQDNSEYRVSDNDGASWSDWTPIVTLVLDRSLTPGPYFLVEDYSGGGASYDGVDTPRFNAARDAAVAAGGGTVTTLARGTVRMVTNHQPRAGVHYLFPNCKRPDMIHVPTGTDVDDYPSGGGPQDGWQPGWSESMFAFTHSSLVGAARVNVVGGKLDGNAFRQAIHIGFTGTPAGSSEWGKAWPGNRSNSSTFSLQLQRLIGLQGSSSLSGASNGALASARAKLGVHGVHFRTVPADAIQGTGSSDLVTNDCIFEGCFRGGMVVDFGNSIVRAKRGAYILNRTDDHIQSFSSGIDHEILGFGSPTSWFLDIEHEDELILQDMELNPRQGPTPSHVLRGCHVGPGLDWLAKGVVQRQVVIHEGSTNSPRTKIFYHRKAPTGGNFPASAIRGWAGTTPHDMTVEFNDCDFITFGRYWVYHEKRITPTAGTWQIEIGETWDTSDPMLVKLVNCTASVGSGMPSGTNTIRLFNTVKALTQTQVVRLDGLTIGAGFAQAAVLLNGQRLEYRNVSHLGLGGTIQQICPGAGTYVQI